MDGICAVLVAVTLYLPDFKAFDATSMITHCTNLAAFFCISFGKNKIFSDGAIQTRNRWQQMSYMLFSTEHPTFWPRYLGIKSLNKKG